jgi:hypothetical protein
MVRIGTERAALLRRQSPSPKPPSLPRASAARSGSRLIAARRCRAGTRASGDAVFGYHNSRRTPSNKPSLFAAHEILGGAATRGPRANRHGGRLSEIHGCAPAEHPGRATSTPAIATRRSHRRARRPTRQASRRVEAPRQVHVLDHPASQWGHRHLPSFQDRLGPTGPTGRRDTLNCSNQRCRAPPRRSRSVQYREFCSSRPPSATIGSISIAEFNGLRPNSLRIGTGNLIRPCRELIRAIREFFRLIRESRAGRDFTAT